MKPSYEYTQLYISFKDGSNHTKELNNMGHDGWDLISCVKIDDANIMYVFKRDTTTKTLLN